MKPIMIARAGVTLLALAGVLSATACELPPALLAVNTTADGADADPGDGVCETAPGNGVCSLRAAVAEGNALGEADLTVPAGTYSLTVVDAGDANVDLDITGALKVNWLAPAAVEITPSVEVAAGGALSIDGVKVSGFTRVGGDLFANRSSLAGPFVSSPVADATVEITSTGRAIISNSGVFGWSLRGVVYNQGNLELVYSTVTGIPYSTTPMLTTATGASSGLTASRFTAIASFHSMIIVDYSGMPACSGPVMSHGYNTTLNTSCALTQPGDTQNGANNAWVDRIPQGVLSCGVTAIDDQLGNPRPVDGNGDSTAACDTGALEVAAP